MAQIGYLPTARDLSIRVAGVRRTGERSDTRTAIDSKESIDMDLVEAYTAAAARAGELIAATRPDQLESSTPLLDRLIALSGRRP
jgi:hypothetical protein